MKTAWIFQGGWDGHEPKLVSRRFQRLLEKNGYKAEIFDTLDPMADLEALKALDLIVPCWTMGAIPSEYTKNVSIGQQKAFSFRISCIARSNSFPAANVKELPLQEPLSVTNR